ncbi:DNA transfer protein [Providencia heimbachae]|uniref:DNA transfer protein n=1 Tax=Providencia heimbachae TaxID=333962 RepID=UPI00141997EA|nr:DNA transfer protein [Providencia heimbachae]NIH21857.1 DNA transfer protein [Providencia heimbachae]
MAINIFALGRKLRGEEPLFLEKGGKGGGGDGGASAQARATDNATALQQQIWQTTMQNLSPFTGLAQQYVNQMQNLSSPEGQAQALNGYYNSQQFNDLSNQARYQNLAGAEAMGGLGSTATGNSLASIAPLLGQGYLSDQMNNYQNLANVGLGALQGQANAGQNYANNTGQLLQQGAAAQAAAANRPSGMQQGIMGGLGGASAGMAIGGPWGAAIGGGLGVLGSLF